jgi:hypothetical protein
MASSIVISAEASRPHIGVQVIRAQLSIAAQLNGSPERLSSKYQRHK